MKKGAWIAVCVVVLIAAAAALSRAGGVEVVVAIVRPDTLSVTIPTEGRTRAGDRFIVAAPISGRLARIDLEEGDLVLEGELLARLYPAPEDPRVIATVRAEVSAAEARYQEAQSRLSEAELQEVQARREVDRRRPLLDIGAITAERMEQAELAAVVATQRRESAEAARASASAALEGAQAQLLGAETADDGVRPVHVSAPVSGRVVAVPDESERVVLAGSPLVELADTDGLEVVLDILSEDAVLVRPGNGVVITGWGGEGVLRGEVRVVTLVGYTKVSALGVEEQRVDVVADLYQTPPTLGTGYRVSGEIVVWTGVGVLTVPVSGLFRFGDEWQAFVVEDGRAVRRTVAIGRRNDEGAEVLGGLESGDAVILFPPEAVDEGAAVTVTAGASPERG